MVYAMSDLHGAYDKFMKMLSLIDYSSEDTLYVIGDICDRQEGGVKILQEMMKRHNVIPICGNHEYMMMKCLPFLQKEISEESIRELDTDTMQDLTEWMNVGGSVTINEFYKLTQEEKQEVIDYVKEFDLYAEITAGGKEFVLVHAGLMNFKEDRPLEDYDISELLFYRSDCERQYFKDKYLVTGHTPTWLIRALEEGETLGTFKLTPEKGTIYKKNNNIAIDCGCGYKGKLGCICLDNFEEFYV